MLNVLAITGLFCLLVGSPLPNLAEGATGELDPTFGIGGLATADFDGQEDEAFAFTIQRDGKVIIAGDTFTTVTDADFALARVNLDGTLDSTFGIGGKVTTPFLTAGIGGVDRALAVIVQSDDKIIAAGFANNRFSGSREFALARYHPNGTLDDAFGVGGKVMTAFTSDGIILGLSLLTDGRIVAVGKSSGVGVAIAHYNPDGSLDPTFGAGGRLTVPFFSNATNIFAVAFQPDGKIIAGGFTGPSLFSVDAAIARYNGDGTPDQSFASGGKLILDFGGNDEVDAIAIQRDGRILAAGRFGVFDLLRLNSDGSADSNFGAAGRVTAESFGVGDGTGAIAIQPDNKIVLGGFASVGNHRGFGLARYEVNGSPDLTFGSVGEVVTDVNTFKGPVGIGLQADGKILAAGQAFGSTYDFIVARYVGTSFDLCIQDESNGNLLQINSATGDYQFTNCSGLTLSGTGGLIKRGNTITLQHYSADRRVLAKVDGSVNKATAYIQTQGMSFTIVDRNTADETCACT